jgi:heat shock protein HtpX
MVGIVLAILSPIAGVIIQLAISRKREFVADATGALLTRYPEGLASALEKISSYTSTMRITHRATAHLFISSPLGGISKNTTGWFSRLFMTHPPIEDRIAALRGIEK